MLNLESAAWALGAAGASRGAPHVCSPPAENESGLWGAGALTAPRPCGTRATRLPAGPRWPAGTAAPPCSDASPRSKSREPRFDREGDTVSSHGQDAATEKVEPFWLILPTARF